MDYIYKKEFWKAAATRAIRTLAQTFLACGATAKVLEDLNWNYVISASILAAFCSIATSIIGGGLPEAKE